MEDKEMTAEEVAEFLGISRTSLQRILKTKELKPTTELNPLLTRPRKLLFRRSDVIAYRDKKIAEKNSPHLAAAA